MKKLTLIALTITALISATVASGEEWTLEGSTLKAKGGTPAQISNSPKLAISASLSSTHLILNLSDGKQKFGAPSIKIQNGENVLMRPRLKLTVPIEEVRNVVSGTPLLVSSFLVGDSSFKINLVHSGGEIPNVVITSE